jgi:glycine/D-amino acid oxidase-like deaminating enzyme
MTAPVEAKGFFDIAVIGAGVFGAWSAERLQRAGARVALIDQYGPAHVRASSAGESRVTRLSYGGDALYSELARESLADWAELSERASPPLFHRIGVLWFADADNAYTARSLAYLRASGGAHRALDARALAQAYPQMRFHDSEAGFLEVDSGALMAGRAVQTLVAMARLPFARARIGPPLRKNGVYELTPSIGAAALVYALGPWLPQVFPFLERRITATRQEVMHFGVAPGDDRFAPPRLPTWLDFNGGDMVYGMPDLEGQGFKIAFDRNGAPIDPDTQDRRLSPHSAEEARAYLKRRFPDLAQAPLVHARVCQYENSSNGDFLIDRHPEFENVWLVGAGSGHGFKHGPAVGRLVAEHALDARKPIEPRFSLATKGALAARTVY